MAVLRRYTKGMNGRGCRSLGVRAALGPLGVALQMPYACHCGAAAAGARRVQLGHGARGSALPRSRLPPPSWPRLLTHHRIMRGFSGLCLIVEQRARAGGRRSVVSFSRCENGEQMAAPDLLPIASSPRKPAAVQSRTWPARCKPLPQTCSPSRRFASRVRYRQGSGAHAADCATLAANAWLWEPGPSGPAAPPAAWLARPRWMCSVVRVVRWRNGVPDSARYLQSS